MKRAYCFAALLLVSTQVLADITCVFKYNRETRKIERECKGNGALLSLSREEQKVLREGRASSCEIEIKSDTSKGPGMIPGPSTITRQCR